MAFQTITADGTLTFVLPSGSDLHTITVDGTFGGGTATFFKREGTSGTAIALVDESAAVITATSANLGLYTVTFLNTTPKMTADFEIQAVTITASHVTYLSNVLNIPV